MAESPQNYETAVAHMFSLGHELANTPANKFDLAHVRVLLEALGGPERRFPSVLIAGTNGKGSTAATLAAILSASGLRTGLYTSPHLVRINERIRIDGEAIADQEFALLHALVDRRRRTFSMRGRVALASQLLRDAHRHRFRTLCAAGRRPRRPRSRHGWKARRY